MFLVTGGAGFIGSHVIDALLSRGETVVCIDDFNDFYDPHIKRKNVEPHLRSNRYHLITADIRDLAAMTAVFREYDIKRVVHLAARAGVRPSLLQPILYEEVNIRATLQLLELSRTHDVKQFIFASSSSVYGGNTQVPFREDDRIAKTVSPYAATKYAGELLCYTYHHLYGMPTTCLRFFTVYGPRQRPEMAIHQFVRLMYENKPVLVFGDGSTARDYTYIGDIVLGILGAIDNPVPFEVFNLGESEPIRLSVVLSSIEEVFGKKLQIHYAPEQPGDVKITFADVTKAKEQLNYRPQTPFKQGLQKFLEWYETRLL